MKEPMMRMTPIDLDREGRPRDAKLGTAVQEYCKKQFGDEISFNYYLRVWAVLLLREEEPEYFEVIGVTSIRNQVDCPIFHITPPTMDKEGLKVAEQARDMAVYRMYGYLEDLGQRGNTVLIHVSEKAQRYWKRFLGKIKAKPANRFEMTI